MVEARPSKAARREDNEQPDPSTSAQASQNANQDPEESKGGQNKNAGGSSRGGKMMRDDELVINTSE